ncbi:hypothetical protein [Horticoccus luteus]|nr:hypothetical protein [Horticoccus luteus]
MDNHPVLTLFLRTIMEQTSPKEKHASAVTVVVDIILVAAFFAFMFWVMKAHVPSSDPKMITLWGALTALCLTGVFWLALWMFRMVWRFQYRRPAE